MTPETQEGVAQGDRALIFKSFLIALKLPNWHKISLGFWWNMKSANNVPGNFVSNAHFWMRFLSMFS